MPPDDNSPFAQDRLFYSRSKDLCEWEDYSPILSTRIPNTQDEKAIWAPYVYHENGIYHMYYTGVTEEATQSNLLATQPIPPIRIHGKHMTWYFNPIIAK